VKAILNLPGTSAPFAGITTGRPGCEQAREAALEQRGTAAWNGTGAEGACSSPRLATF
jgi:hypothetical protein